MAAENIQNLMKVPGQLCINPTNLANAFPHGGTALGYVQDVILLPSQSTVQITAEEFGITVVEELDLGRSWVLGANLRGWDDNVYSTIFPGTATGSSSGRTFISETKTSPRAGTRMTIRSVILCFSPEDLDRHKVVLFRRAIPKLNESAEVNKSLINEELIAAIFQAIPDTTDRYVEWGLREDLTI